MAQIPGKHNVEKVSKFLVFPNRKPLLGRGRGWSSFQQLQQQVSCPSRRPGGSGGRGSTTFLVGAALAVVRSGLVDRALADPADGKARLAVGVKPEEDTRHRYTTIPTPEGLQGRRVRPQAGWT